MNLSTSKEILSLFTHVNPHNAAQELNRLAHKHQLVITPPSQSLKPAAVLIPLVERQGELHIVLTQRAATLSQHAGQVSFPGGKLNDRFENVIAAALREAQEEIGVHNICVLAELGTYHSYSGFSISTILGLMSTPIPYKLNPHEVESVFEVPLKKILQPKNFEYQRINKGGQWRQYYQLYHDDKRIWGFTGSVLFLFSQWLHTLTEQTKPAFLPHSILP